MISQLMSSSPVSGSVLTAHSLDPASDSVVSLSSLPLPHSHSVSLKDKHLKKKAQQMGVMVGLLPTWVTFYTAQDRWQWGQIS